MTRQHLSPTAAVRGLLVIGMVLGFLCDDALAQQAVQLSGVPEELSFPLPAGRNLVLTAEVEGAEPRAVWLARSREAHLRYVLSRLGQGRYQVNLADSEIARVLAGGGDRFQIFAELPGGEVIASIPVHYSTARRLHLPPRVYVLMDGKRREVLRRPSDDPFLEPALRARLTGQSVVVSAEGIPALPAHAGEVRTHWCPPERVQKVQFEFPTEAVKPAVEARVGDKAWPAEPAGRTSVLTLPITPELRLAWMQRQTMNLVCTESEAEVLRLALRAPPSRLDLPGDKAELTITQRTSKAVPGSDGYLAIYLDDITGGQVRLSLAAVGGERLIDGKPLREGDTVGFATREALYAITVEKLVNYLVGDDYAVLAVAPASAEMVAAEQERIQGLLAALAKADVVFVCDSEELTAPRMAAALRERLAHATAKVPTLEQFIARVASRSGDTGEEYQVRRPGEGPIRARTWLNGLAAAPARPPGGQAAPGPARSWAQAMEKPGLPNLHRVTKTVYRGAQPTAEGIRELKAMGVKTIINLRSLHSDRDLLEGTGLDYVAIPCHAWHPEEEDVIQFLKVISDETKGPFFVHCQRGSDRTGMMMAIYRVACQGWSKTEAIDEMTRGTFGFNPIWTDITAYVRDLDVEAIRRKAR